jgi:hypothetical protein
VNVAIKMFELKIILVINMRKKVVYFSFYFNLKIVRFFCRTLYNEFDVLMPTKAILPSLTMKSLLIEERILLGAHPILHISRIRVNKWYVFRSFHNVAKSDNNLI